jgi:hypothetical protein
VPVRVPIVRAQSFLELKSQVDILMCDLVDNNPLFRSLLEAKRNAIIQRVRYFNQEFARLPNPSFWQPHDIMVFSCHLLSILNEIIRYQIEIGVLIRLNVPNI